MEKGFYHSEYGYWQTLLEPSEKVLESYPVGTIEVPLRPTDAIYEWNEKWVKVAENPEPSQEESPEQKLLRLSVEIDQLKKDMEN